MYEAIRTFRQKLSAGHVCLGLGISLTDSVVCEALADSVDYFWIDLEHTHIDFSSLKAHLIACRAGGKPGLVRVRGSEVFHIKSVLDIGADGIIVPQVRSAAEVRQIVAACRYAPQGNRGFGPRAPSNYGRIGGPDYFSSANESIFVVAQVENVEALSEIDAIVAVEGLDSIALGPYDLSISMGHIGDIYHPDVVEAMSRVTRAARNAGIFAGIGGVDLKFAAVAKHIGVHWMQVGDDFSHMIRHVDETFAAIRRDLEMKK